MQSYQPKLPLAAIRNDGSNQVTFSLNNDSSQERCFVRAA